MSDAARPITRNAETVSADPSPPAGSSATILPALHDYLQRFGDFGGHPLDPRRYVWPVTSVRDASTGEEVSTEHVGELLEKSLRRTALPSCFLRNYGSGKTSFVDVGNEVAGEALSGGAELWIPIYLCLGFAQGKWDLLQAMSDYLAR